MADASTLSTSYGPNLSCFQTVKESKVTDVVLVTGFVALLIIGILASTGVFQSIGTTNASNLSYGMYAGAALFFIAEIFKLVVNYLKKKSEETEKNKTQHSIKFNEEKKLELDKSKFVNEQIEKFEVSNRCSGGYRSCAHTCQITFNDGLSLKRKLSYVEISVLATYIDKKKVTVLKDTSSNFDMGYHFQAIPTDTTVQEIIHKIKSEKAD